MMSSTHMVCRLLHALYGDTNLFTLGCSSLNFMVVLFDVAELTNMYRTIYMHVRRHLISNIQHAKPCLLSELH